MAERRMFAKNIIESDAFLDLPMSARLLYYDLGMHGDDDGFVDSPKRVMRLTGASEDDLKLLFAKQFLIPFENGVVVIRHWKIHYYIRIDRYKPTRYQAEKSLILEDVNGVYSYASTTCLPVGIPVGDQASTTCLPVGCITEGRETEDRGRERKDSAPTPYEEIVNLYNSICVSFPRIKRLSDDRKKSIKARLNHYSSEDFKQLFEMAENSSFLKGCNAKNWTATFDWLITDRNIAKVLDGNYTDATPLQRKTSASGVDGSEDDVRYNV